VMVRTAYPEAALWLGISHRRLFKQPLDKCDK
jgi:hypothetical protein